METIDAVEFTVSIVGETTGETLRGSFKAKKRLSHSDKLRRDAFRRELLGQISPDSASAEAQSLALGIADLKVRLVATPNWWKEANDGLDLSDEAVLVDVYTKAQKVESDAKAAIQKAAAQAAEELKKD